MFSAGEKFEYETFVKPVEGASHALLCFLVQEFVAILNETYDKSTIFNLFWDISSTVLTENPKNLITFNIFFWL